MKQFIVLSLLALSILICKAQRFAIVNDPDGYVNMRKAASIKSPVVAKINNGDLLIFYDDDPKNNWRSIARPVYISDFTSAHNSPVDQRLDGYVYENRLIWIDKLPQMKNKQLYKNRVIIKNDSLVFSVSIKPFLIKNHKVGKDQAHYGDKVDNKHAFGTDGDLPHTEFSNFTMSFNGQEIIIPKSAYNDLFDPNLNNIHINFDNRGTVYVEMLGSDGAGYYDVIWVFKDGKLVKRYLDNSNP